MPLETRIRSAFDAGRLPGLHAALVDRGAARLAELYFPGDDEIWGRRIGPWGAEAPCLHDVRSVTKSLVGLLYGIALAEGRVPGLDAPLLAQFPDDARYSDGGAKDRILVGHALSMTMGLRWQEGMDYTQPGNDEVGMETATDRTAYILSRPMVEEPGARWCYCGGAVALLGALIAQGTRQRIEDFARDRLFDPLGIGFEWSCGPQDGVASAASGLRLTTLGLARIGALVRNGGVWEGRQVVPADWLQASLVPRVRVDGDLSYGFLWYVPGDGSVFAAGNGGQRLTVAAGRGLVVVALAGRYNDPGAYSTPNALWQQVIQVGSARVTG